MIFAGAGETVAPYLTRTLTATAGTGQSVQPAELRSYEKRAILRWLGAAYLVWTGYKMLRNPRRAWVAGVPGAQARHQAFATGALTNLLNPKVGVFYVSFLPQFVPDGVSVGPFILLLGDIHALLGMIWFYVPDCDNAPSCDFCSIRVQCLRAIG